MSPTPRRPGRGRREDAHGCRDDGTDRREYATDRRDDATDRRDADRSAGGRRWRPWRRRADAALAVAVVACLVLAGCAAPVDRPRGGETPAPAGTTAGPGTAPATGTTAGAGDGTTGGPGTADGPRGTDDAATPDGSGDSDGAGGDGSAAIPVRGAASPFTTPPSTVYRRVRNLTGRTAPPPRSVRVLTRGDLGDGSGRPGRPPQFWRVLGVEAGEGLNESERARIESGRAGALGSVTVYAGNNDSTRLAIVLAHEFAHYLQFVDRVPTTLAVRLPDTTEGRYVRRAIVEGAAVVVADAYARRHLPGDRTNAQLYDRLADRLDRGTVRFYRNERYRDGRRYVAARVGDPANLSAVYADPPRTAEQLLHPDREEPPASLSVRAPGTDRWRYVGRDRLGEAFVRLALHDVSPDRARRAGAGWGNDSLRLYRPVGDRDGGDGAPNGTAGGRAPIDRGYVWTLRWDRAADAAEFLRTARATLDARGTGIVLGDGSRAHRVPLAGGDRAGDGGTRTATVALARVGGRTVVLVAGPPRFVAGTDVAPGTGTGDGAAEVAVDLPGSAE